MSDEIKHECGLALIRLRKPLQYYVDKYGTSLYGLKKLYLLMEKQHNRGQDGAGVATIKFDTPPGKRYISRKRSNSNKPIQDIFQYINEKFVQAHKENPNYDKDPEWLKDNYGFTGELLMGHLRYGTFGGQSIEHCHPFLRQNNWKSRNLVLAGNFNMTNVDELFGLLVELGQHPKEKADTVTCLEKIGHFLDEENQELFEQYKNEGFTNREISEKIANNIDIEKILKKSTSDFDGGYVMGGLIGHGDAFVTRDPSGIRPASYYVDDEIVVVASERAAIQTAFNVGAENIQEIKPGHAVIIKRDGTVNETQILEPKKRLECSFERIYFSRGSDLDIYKERKALGALLKDKILESVNYDVRNTVFSYIPNTAESSFYGMVHGMEEYLKEYKKSKVLELGANVTDEALEEILSLKPRIEKAAIKDAKLRTFISEDSGRDDLVAHVYDITYGVIKPEQDNLVIIDDSIVRGTTLKQSILRILDRLGPKKIVVVSSAPQIRYPDCYGIDMARLGDFAAFRAAIELLKERGMQRIIDEVYRLCKEQEFLPKEDVVNHVKKIYEPFTDEEVSDKISDMLKPVGINADVQIVYQSIDALHIACPDHKGDWYFSGDYPTPGGNKVVNRSFIYYMEGSNKRAY